VASVEALANLLQSGTMVFDAIMYMGIVRSGALRTHESIFDFQEKNVGSMSDQIDSIAKLTAAVIILYTRGSLPATNTASETQKLPKFISNMSGLSDYETELDLRDGIMSFDPKHISLVSIMSADVYEGWDDIVANRMNLGVAGHKPLKVVADLWTYFPEAAKRDGSLIQRLKLKYDEMNGGFYLALHPVFGTVASFYNKFYLNCMKAIFDSLSGNNNARYEILDGLQYLSKDNNIVNKRLHRFSASYLTWDYSKWDDLFGTISKFSSTGRGEHVENPVALQVFEDERETMVDLPED
jgi:hypothetical protein